MLALGCPPPSPLSEGVSTNGVELVAGTAGELEGVTNASELVGAAGMKLLEETIPPSSLESTGKLENDGTGGTGGNEEKPPPPLQQFSPVILDTR